jgi:hypothetical protein
MLVSWEGAMPEMLIDYDVVSIDDKDGPQGPAEHAVLLMIHTHAHFANTRYLAKPKPAPAWKNIPYRPYYQGLHEVAEKLVEAGRHPDDFVSFCFQYWKTYGINPRLKDKEIKFQNGFTTHGDQQPGVAFPSLSILAKNTGENGDDLSAFLSREDYVPMDFTTLAQERRFRVPLIMSIIHTQCAVHIPEPIPFEDWWRDADLFVKHCRDISRWEMLSPFFEEIADEFEKEYGLTPAEWGAAVQQEHEENIDSTPREFPAGFQRPWRDKFYIIEPTEEEQAKYDFVTAAQDRGIDVESPEFEAELQQFLKSNRNPDHQEPVDVLLDFCALWDARNQK